MKEEVKWRDENLLQSIISLIDSVHKQVVAAVNSELTLLYRSIGKQINQDTLNNTRADYEKTVVAELSKQLTKLYGTGFSNSNLHHFMKFKKFYPDEKIIHTMSRQLT